VACLATRVSGLVGWATNGPPPGQETSGEYWKNLGPAARVICTLAGAAVGAVVGALIGGPSSRWRGPLAGSGARVRKTQGRVLPANQPTATARLSAGAISGRHHELARVTK
jgi:hypothetical protein